MKKKLQNKTDPYHVFFIEASAGAGKTHALSKRYLQFLLGSCADSEDTPLRNILAITFTNKAAFEMKGRILSFLKQIAFDCFNNENIKKDMIDTLELTTEEAEKKAVIAFEHLIKDYSFFQVETIDSFMNSILQAFAFKTRFSSAFSMKTDYEHYLEYSLDCLVDSASSDERVLKKMRNFITHFLFIENKQGWLPKKSILKLVKGLYETANIYRGGFRKSSSGLKDIQSLTKSISSDLQELLRILPEETHKTFLKSISSYVKKNRKNSQLNDLPGFFRKKTIPVKKGFEMPVSTFMLWEKVRKEVSDFARLKAFSFFDSYIDIFQGTMNFFHDLVSAEDVLFVAELNKRASNLLEGDETQVPELYYRLATRFFYYLIDEFQDTSILQWQNLYPMVFEALSSGGSLLTVGDMRQAIYRFRGGSSQLFNKISDLFVGYGVSREYLNINYRSRMEIVRFNNNIFSEKNLHGFCKNPEIKVELATKDEDEITGIFSHSNQAWLESRSGGYVDVKFINEDDPVLTEMAIKERLIELVRDLKGRGRSEIAILARKNDEVEKITSWLSEEDFPVESDRTLSVKEQPLIKEIVSFLIFLQSPIDNVAFASFIMGEIFTKVTGLGTEEVRKFLFRINRDNPDKLRTVYYYSEFREKYPEIWKKYIEIFFSKVGIYPLYEFVSEVFKVYDICTLFPQYQGFFMRFLEVIKESETDYTDITSFLEFFTGEHDENIDYIHMSYHHSDRIRVMTFHKAKGLEFDTVIIPFFATEIKVSPQVIHQSGDDLSIIYMSKDLVCCNQDLERIYKEEYKKVLSDELNAAYVALTRAREELYVFVPEKSGRRKNIFRWLFPDEHMHYGKPGDDKSRDLPEKVCIKELPPVTFSDWFSLLEEEFSRESELKNRKRIRKGEIAHYMFSCIGNLYGRDSDKVIEHALEKTRAAFPWNDIANIEKNVKEILWNEKTRHFFFITEGTVFCEKEVVSRLGLNRKIDRLIVFKNEVWVADYKSSSDDREDYREQVTEYMNIVRDIYPEKKVRGFLIYLDRVMVEEVKSEE